MFNLLVFTAFVGKSFGQNDQLSIPHPFKMFSQNTENQVGPVTDRSGATCVPDSILYFQYKTANDSTIGNKWVYQYDSKGNEVKFWRYQKSATNDDLLLLTFDSAIYNSQNQKIFSQRADNPPGTTLTYVSQTVYFPRGNSSFNDSTIRKTAINNGNFDNETKMIYVFDGNERVVKQIEHLGNGTGWDINSMIETVFTIDGKIDSIFNSSWNGQKFVRFGQSKYSYDAQDSLILIFHTDLDKNRPSFKVVFNYHLVANSVKNELSVWDDFTQGLKLYSQNWFDYDDEKRLEFTQQLYHIIGGISAGRQVYNYPNNADCVQFINNYGSSDGLAFNFSSRIFYYYGNIIATKHPAGWQNQISISPNPATDFLKIQTPENTRIQLTDLAGKTLRSIQNTNGQTEINLENLPDGLYFLILMHGGLVFFKKIVVSKN